MIYTKELCEKISKHAIEKANNEIDLDKKHYFLDVAKKFMDIYNRIVENERANHGI